MQYTNSKGVTVRVQYKVAGKSYTSVTEDDVGYPFDEIDVAPGATVDLGDAKIIKDFELTTGSSSIDYRA